ncbi:hypothetical protein [Nonomuraea sp. NPDC049141]|uniref:hypothetical protein n=1 Tax=Nonomuraea sp. NPDC049141 TaxID=3155500 RepID=UPI0033DD8B42
MEIVKILVALVILIPCALYGISAMRREREQPEPQPQPQPGQEQAQTPPFEPDPATHTVQQTFNKTEKVTNVALTWVKQAITGGSDSTRPAIDPPRPRPGLEDGWEWKPPTSLDGLPDLTEYDVEVEPSAPHTPPPPDRVQAAKAIVIERGLFDRLRDLFSSGDKPAALPPREPAQPPALGQADPDWIAAIPDPRQFPEPELPNLPEPELPALDIPAGFDVAIERVPTTAVPEPTNPIALPPANPPPESTVTAEVIEPVEIIAPIDLQGVDMELVPLGRRTMAHVPTPGGLRVALKTGGFRIFRGWLASFRKANDTDLGHAKHMHRMALAHVQRARVKLAVAANMLMAVQSDGIGPNVVRRCMTTFSQCQREYAAAFQAATATAALVRASGGTPTSIKDAIHALERDHGGMAVAARKMTVEPVRDLEWYRR